MPIYEYQCEACSHQLEALQQISDSPLRKCPECGRPKLKRLISPPVFRLKGSGWYETDFKSDRENRRNLADHPEPAESKSEAKTDGAGTRAEEKKMDGKEAASSPSRPAKTRPSRPKRSSAARARHKARPNASRR